MSELYRTDVAEILQVAHEAGMACADKLLAERTPAASVEGQREPSSYPKVKKCTCLVPPMDDPYDVDTTRPRTCPIHDGYVAAAPADQRESREQKAARLVRESGKKTHASDCATSVAPAEEPGPCDCNEVGVDQRKWTWTHCPICGQQLAEGIFVCGHSYSDIGKAVSQAPVVHLKPEEEALRLAEKFSRDHLLWAPYVGDLAALLASVASRARLEEAEWWASKAGHIGPAPGVDPDTSCEKCMRIIGMRAALRAQAPGGKT
jgi:hypothetical protein